MESSKITCQCSNSIKLKIIQFVAQSQQCVTMEYAIEKMLLMIQSELKDAMDLNEAFLKGHIRGLISDLISEKLITSSVISLNEEVASHDYYYMKFDKALDGIFNQKEEIQEKEGKQDKMAKTRNEDNSVHKAKVDECLQLKKTLEQKKKESRTKELIKVLHQYNELKDIAQELLGRVASHRNIRIKELYEELEISDDEA